MNTRRHFLTASAATLAAASLSHRLSAADAATGLKGRINHSACKWCYKGIELDDLCRAGKEMGLTSIELTDPPDFPTLQKHGLTSAIISFPTIKDKADNAIGSIPHGFNNPANHDLLVQAYEPHLKACAEFGAKNVICFSGNRNGMDDEQGLENCVAGLKKVLPIAEKHGITLLGSLGFENAYAFAMRRDRAAALNIRTIDDLARHARNLSVAGDFEFFARPEWPAVRDAYGLQFREQRQMQSTFMYEAAAAGEADVITAFSSDGRIAQYDLVVLDDPKNALPPYDAILLLAPKRAKDKKLIDVLTPLIGAIDAEAMRAANLRSDRTTDKETPATAARWLNKQIGRR